MNDTILSQPETVEQTYFGSPDQFIDYILDSQFNLDNGNILPDAGVPFRTDSGGFNLVIVRWQPKRLLTPEEKAATGIPGHVDAYSFGDKEDIGGIKVKPVGEMAVWHSFSKHPDGKRFALTLAETIKGAQLGSDPIITRYTEDGQIVTEWGLPAPGQGTALPQLPGPNATRGDYHRYRYNCAKIGIKVPHKIFAEKFNVTVGTTRNYYSKWLYDNGLESDDEK